MNLKAIAAIPFFFLVSISASYAAGWVVKTEVDSMTDERTHEAQTVNASGHSLHIYRLGDGSTWITFRLNGKSIEVLGEKPPMMRVDKKEPFDFQLIKDLVRMNRETFRENPIKVAYRPEPKWVSASVYNGNDLPDRGPIFDLMNGKKVTVRYYLFTGGYKETGFPLDGAKEAITKALVGTTR
ncbi:MAG: hypothetical protein AB1560_02015 [Pseudomonadota bacterium]